MAQRPFDSPYRNTIVRIADLTVMSDILEGVRFEGCQIVGPAVLALMDDNTIAGGTFEAPVDHITIPAETTRPYFGIVGLRRCEFYNCQFTRIGFLAPPDVIDQMRSATDEH